MKTAWIITCIGFTAIAFHIYADRAYAVAPITPSGLNTQINPSTDAPAGTVQYNITGGTRAGTNLFHSFADFGVPSHTIANFLNTPVGGTLPSTSNILGRVTGGTPSNIFGTIQTTGFGNANLFLMNPAGIVFGPNASLNVGGSVNFTTADYLRLTDGARFNAIPNAGTDALLSTAAVSAFGFVGPNSGVILVQGSHLSLATSKDFSLVGGNITIQGWVPESGATQTARLSAPNGRINLATTQSAGEFLPNLNGVSFRSFGSVHLEPGSTVDVSQTGNGKVSVRNGQLILEIHNTVLDTTAGLTPTAVEARQDTIVLSPGSSILSRTSSADQGPDVQIFADRVRFSGSPTQSRTIPGKPVNILTRTDASGDAGNIAVRTSGNLDVGSVDIESTSGFTWDGTAPSPERTSGNAGNVELSSSHGNILITGNKTLVTSQTWNSSGKTGNVIASAPEGDITIQDGANLFVSNDGSGAPGHVEIVANNLAMLNGLISNDNFGQPKPGNITVTLTGNLRVAGGSQIYTTSITDASAGDINLTAKDIVTTQGSIINSATFASGPGGNLKVVADTLQVTDGAELSSGSTKAPNRGSFPQHLNPSGRGGDITIQTLGPSGSVLVDGPQSGIFADTEGTGAGGTINLFAKSLTIQNGGAISTSTTGTNLRATGGSITVNATDQVMLTSGGSITASSIVKPETSQSGIANAGNISINAGQHLDLLDHSSITTTTQTAQANGGDIDIRAIDRVRLVDSTISTSVKGAEGSGGNIFIDPKVVMLEGSNVTAQAVGGAGGNITLVTPLFLADSSSLISASSQRGVSGTVTIQSPTSNLSATVGQLVSKTSPPQVLLQNRCMALAGGEQSTFLLAGRDTLPTEPDGWLNSPVSMEHLTGESTEQASSLKVRSKRLNRLSAMTERKDKTNILSLRQLTPPGFLVRTFATGSTGCPS
ncbi:MAG: filamentous hemagglutinin N-terminal domain-containing protein [Nitrospira sp.]|nr:filamentous hemagglutinin N-terminal domain-containing protein [Nitrospira sp.]